MRRSILVSVFLVVFSGAVLWAQDPDPTDYAAYYPNHARGHVNTVFDAGALDDVNLYSGNLTLSVPLGPPLHPGGDLRFQLALHYNSALWAAEKRCSGHVNGLVPDQCNQFGTGALLGAPDVGLGWSLELGHIAPRFPGELFLVTPDGGEHQLFTSRYAGYGTCQMLTAESVCYTRDGSDVKVVRRSTPGTYDAYFPDGTIHEYTRILDNYDEGPSSPTYVGRDYARQRDGTYCTRMRDRWGNRVDVTYHDNSDLNNVEHTWWHEAYDHATEYPPPGSVKQVRQLIPATVTEYRADGTPLRRAVVEVERPANLEGRTRPQRVSHVTFSWWDVDASAWVQLLRYNLTYLSDSEQEAPPRLQLVQYYPAVTIEAAKRTDWVYLLESVAVDGEDLEYGFRYWSCASDLYQGCAGIPQEDVFATSSDVFPQRRGMQLGTLRQVELPTGGTVSYDYAVWRKAHHTLEPSNGTIQCEVQSILCGPPPGGESEPTCADVNTYSLGVARREARDRDGSTLDHETYAHASSSYLGLPVRFDAGFPEAPNPAIDHPDESSPYPDQYLTSSSTTTVTTHNVADIPPRSDDAEYVFSLGTAVVDRDGNCLVDGGEPLTFPLSGALVYERQYRGTGATRSPARTSVHTYTVDDEALNWAGNGSRFGTQVSRRPREVVTYDHGAAPGGADLVTITRYGYEYDHCTPSLGTCPNLSDPSLGYTKAFPSHRTTVDSQTSFASSVGFSEATMYDPLDSATFQRKETTFYWKGGHDAWLLQRPADARVDDLRNGSGVDQRTSREWSASHGEVLAERVHFQPGEETHDKDVVTRYEYVTTAADPGVGQVRRRLVGLGAFMEGSDLNGLAPDLSEYLEYEHATPVRRWLLCQEDAQVPPPPPEAVCTLADAAGRCDGWPKLLRPGLPTGEDAFGSELEWQRTVHPGWRLPTSSLDGNGDGVAVAQYDGLGRLEYLEPAAPEGEETRLSPTWLEHASPYEQKVWVWGAGELVPPAEPPYQVVTRAVYDGLGRLSHLARRRPLTASQGYVEAEFRHQTTSYDGLGTVSRQSDWTAAPDWGVTSATVVRRSDPFGRPEVVERSDGSQTATTYVGRRRADTRVGLPEAELVVKARTVTDYDARGNPVRVLEEKDVSPLGDPDEEPATDEFVVSEHAFDAADRLRSVRVRGAEGTQERDFEYDPRGFLTREWHPELGAGANDYVAYCRHDGLGRPRRQMYRSQSCDSPPATDVLDTYFDAAGRPRETWAEVNGSWFVTTRVDYGASAGDHSVGKPVVETRYTSVTPGIVVPNAECVDPNAVRVTQVNAYRGPQGLLSGRRTEVRFNDSGSGGYQKLDTGYGYDRWGNVAEVRYPALAGHTSCASPPTVSLDWDAAGVVGVEETVDGLTQAVLSSPTYDPATGMMTAWTTPAGVRGGTPILRTVTHQVLPDGTRPRVSRITAARTGYPAFFDTGQYTYDVVGNVTDLAGNGSSTHGWHYGYDDLSRLTLAQDTWSHVEQSYAYDDLGNLTRLGTDTVAVNHFTNRLAAAGTSYDTRGNLATEPTPYGWTRNLRFDIHNRLVAAWASGPGAPADAFAFAYDASGERVLRYRVTGGAVQAASFFLRDQGGNLLTELEWAAGTGAWTRTSDWVYAGREPMVRLGRQDVTGYRTYTTLVTDHLGSTRAEVLDAASPVKMDLFPYGGFVSQPPIVNEKHLFTAHEREFLGTAVSTATLANLDSMHQREYTHRLGRFVSLDPVGGEVGSSQSWNRYSYVRGNPVNLVDPNGEAVALRGDIKKALADIQAMVPPEDRNFVRTREVDGQVVLDTRFLNARSSSQSGNFQALRQVANSPGVVEVDTSAKAFQSDLGGGPTTTSFDEALGGVFLNPDQTVGTSSSQILVNPNLGPKETASTLGHEFRHAKFYLLGIRPYVDPNLSGSGGWKGPTCWCKLRVAKQLG